MSPGTSQLGPKKGWSYLYPPLVRRAVGGARDGRLARRTDTAAPARTIHLIAPPFPSGTGEMSRGFTLPNGHLSGYSAGAELTPDMGNAAAFLRP